jgi:predicted DCC family thiol-disulfide oxidoreductase YuxK
MPEDAADAPAGPVVLFDGVCNLCVASVQFLVEHDDGSLRFAPLQSEAAEAVLSAQDLSPDYFGSLVFVEDDDAYTKSAGALRIARYLDAPYSWARHLRVVPRPLRDAVYDLVARSRYSVFGKKDRCMRPTPDLEARFLARSD